MFDPLGEPGDGADDSPFSTAKREAADAESQRKLLEWQDTISKLRSGSNLSWVYRWLSRKESEASGVPPKRGGTPSARRPLAGATDAAEQAELLADRLQRGVTEPEALSASFLARIAGDCERATAVEVTELRRALSRLRSGRSPGIDQIPTDVYQRLTWLHALLAAVITGILWHGEIPACWKETCLIHLLKPGKDGTECKHWRPVSLLCAILKICERVVSDRLLLEVEHLLPPEAHAYRTGQGVDTCLGALFLGLSDSGKETWGALLALDVDG